MVDTRVMEWWLGDSCAALLLLLLLLVVVMMTAASWWWWWRWCLTWRVAKVMWVFDIAVAAEECLLWSCSKWQLWWCGERWRLLGWRQGEDAVHNHEPVHHHYHPLHHHHQLILVPLQDKDILQPPPLIFVSRQSIPCHPDILLYQFFMRAWFS